MSQRRGTRDQLATVKFFRHETKIVLEILGKFTWLLSLWLQHFGRNILTSKRQVIRFFGCGFIWLSLC